MTPIFRFLNSEAETQEVEPLYVSGECTPANGKKRVWLRPYLIDTMAPAVLICPGGSYQMVSHSNEGDPIALRLNEMGFHAFVLNYRTARKAIYPAPMEDLAQAIRRIKTRAEDMLVDADRLTLLGSSAGGHLCAYFAARYSSFEASSGDSACFLRPHSVILSYPVINLAEDTHAHSRDTLLGKRAPVKERLDKSADLLVTPDYPPTFLWHCEDDRCVPISNSIRMDRALTRNGVTHQFIPFPSGGHGIGLATGLAPEPWLQQAVDFIKEQP